jgi:hypothetical protein
MNLSKLRTLRCVPYDAAQSHHTATFERTNSLIFTAVVVQQAIAMEVLISEVRERNALWNKRNPHYKDRVLSTRNGNRQHVPFPQYSRRYLLSFWYTGEMPFHPLVTEGTDDEIRHKTTYSYI